MSGGSDLCLCLAFFLASESCLLTERFYLMCFPLQPEGGCPGTPRFLLSVACSENKRNAVGCWGGNLCVGSILGQVVALK